MTLKEHLEQIGVNGRQAFDAYCKHFNLRKTKENFNRFDKEYYGTFDNEKDFAFRWMEENDVPEVVQTFVDTEGLATDLLIDKYLYLDGHVFYQ